jgi:hypothetical protein
MVRFKRKNENILKLNFPVNLEFLKTESQIFFSQLNIPLLFRKFNKFIELALDFQLQVNQKKKKITEKSSLHFSTLQTVTVIGKLGINIGVIRYILESNLTVTAVSIYYDGY